MFKRKSRRAMFSAGLTAAITSMLATMLVACEGGDAQQVSADRIISVSDAVIPSDGMGLDAREEAGDAPQLLSAESRHFAIYAAYRGLFEEPAGGTSGASDSIRDALIEKVMSFGLEGVGGAVTACSIRMLMTQD